MSRLPRAKRLPRLPRAKRGGAKRGGGGAKRGESNPLTCMEIAPLLVAARNDILVTERDT